MKHEIYDKVARSYKYTHNKNQLYKFVYDIELNTYAAVFCKPTDTDKALIRAIKGIPRYEVVR